MSEHDELGLFAEPPRARVPRPRRAVDGEPAGEQVVVTNDMDVVEDVLHTARTVGYVQVGGRVCRDSGAEPEPVGEFESAVVGQLIGTGLLRPGRVGRDGARPVEVPAPTQALALRLRAYRRPSTAGERRGLAARQPSEGRR